MPNTKNQAKNKGRFEARGGVINEFDFAANEGAMTEQEHRRFSSQEQQRGPGEEEDRALDEQEQELEAEQESAAAMDADVPQPPDADQTTEGQPS